jgi:hypothetical protein
MSESHGVAIGLKLIELWSRAGLTIRRGVQPADISKFESRFGVNLPPDMRGYYLTVDGMEDELDHGLNRFWPLAMVKPVDLELTSAHADRHAYPSCFVFADHCIWCLAWAVQVTQEPLSTSGAVFQVLGGMPPGRRVAASFSDFMAMYFAEPMSVL